MIPLSNVMYLVVYIQVALSCNDSKPMVNMRVGVTS